MWELSSPTRDQIHVCCIGRWILNHWTTREVLMTHLFHNWKCLPLILPHLFLSGNPFPLANTCLFSESMTLLCLLICLVFYFLKIYVFIFGCTESFLLFKGFCSCSKWELLFSYGTQASHRCGFSCCRAWALKALNNFTSCSMWA